VVSGFLGAVEDEQVVGCRLERWDAHRRVSELSHSPVAQFVESRNVRFAMSESNRPGPGRSTAEAAVSELKKEIARRNDEAQRAAQKLRAERERKRLAQRREWDRY
jgi:hypothetical protein